MVDKFIVEKIAEVFNEKIEKAKNCDDFNVAIGIINDTNKLIENLQHIVNEMKQERHDLVQDIYNKFKGKGYVKTIKFV